MMHILSDLIEDMRVMHQDLGDRLTRVEQIPPLQAVRNVDRILNPNQNNLNPTSLNNMRDGVDINDNPETSTRNQQTNEDTGQQYDPNQNQRGRMQPNDYGEEEDFLPPLRAPHQHKHN